MKKVGLTFPQISLIAATRVALGGGLALLYADRLTERNRKVAGWALFLFGVASTIPLGRMVLDRKIPRKAVKFMEKLEKQEKG